MTTSTGSTIENQQTARKPVVAARTEKPTKAAAVTGKIVYEQPLNERIRTFLRLEYLFKQAAYHLKRNSEWDSRATLQCILEILAIFDNTNLKSEVFKELERHSINLRRHELNPDIDHSQLTALLADIEQKMDAMHGINGQIASDLKKSEFLISIRQRSAIPGGTCDFDLPAYHYWLQQPAAERSRDLTLFLNHFDQIGQAIQLITTLIRNSTPMKPMHAKAGLYQRTFDPNLPFQMVRIALPREMPCFAELSGGRHRFTARFMLFSSLKGRAMQTNQDIEFELACCVI
ncbi:MAG: cell division protein ZapD [Gammaproteobacteria bacterium]